MNWGKTFLRGLLYSRRSDPVMRRVGPVVAAIAVNVLLVAGFAMASVSDKTPMPPVGRPPEPMTVTLMLTDFVPPPPRARPAPHASPLPGETDASLSTRKRKAKAPTVSSPEIDASPAVVGDSGEASAGLAPDGVPEGLRSLLQKPEPCGPTSERNGRTDCKGQYAKLVPPQDDWSLPGLKYYEARFGHVEGVEERHERFKLLFKLMSKPAGAQDPMGQ
ncbi:MAG: hypothetical protein ABI740_04220 [Alphaproteobacteria bacterium]